MVFRRRLFLRLLLAVMLLTPALLSASEFKQYLRNPDPDRYVQPGYMLVDPKGDAYLIRKIDQIPLKLMQALIKRDYRKADIEKEEEARKEFTIGKRPPINVDRLLNKIREVIQKYPKMPPTIGEEHKWSPEAKRYLIYGFWHRMGQFITRQQKGPPAPLFFRSKLFLLLACGYTYRYAITGKEAALEARIMTYPDRGAQLHHVFEESYLLNRGDLYLTLLTAENVLAKNPYAEDRAHSALQKKLAYLRNDSKEMGDNYGAWYHFYGIALYGLIRAQFVSRAVAEIESLGSLFLEGRDPQEDWINRLGAKFGFKLKKLIKSGDWKKPLTKEDRTDYMTQDEFEDEATLKVFGKAPTLEELEQMDRD